MARPKLSEAVITEIKERRKEGLTLLEIEERMQLDRYEATNDPPMPPMPGHGSIQKYAQEYDHLPLAVKILDEPFQWHRLGEYDLPWEASEFLLQMWGYVKELSRDLEWSLQYSAPLPAPTARQAKWWWRVHQAAPDQDNLFVWMWATQLLQCDLFKDILKKTVDVSGIEAYLAYRAWQSPKQQTDYDQAVKDRRIPPLPAAARDAALTEDLRGQPGLTDSFPKPGPRIFEKADFFPELALDRMQRMEEAE